VGGAIGCSSACGCLCTPVRQQQGSRADVDRPQQAKSMSRPISRRASPTSRVDEAKAELRDRFVSEGPGTLWRLGGGPKGCCWSTAGHRQDAVGAPSRRGQRAVLLDQTARNLSRCSSGRGPGARFVRAGRQKRPASSSSTSSTRSAAPAAPPLWRRHERRSRR